MSNIVSLILPLTHSLTHSHMYAYMHPSNHLLTPSISLSLLTDRVTRY